MCCGSCRTLDFVCTVVFAALWTSFVLWFLLHFELRLEFVCVAVFYCVLDFVCTAVLAAFALSFVLRFLLHVGLRLYCSSCCFCTSFVLRVLLRFGLRLCCGFCCALNFICAVVSCCCLDFVCVAVLTAFALHFR